MIDLVKNLATAPRRTKASVIRELLKLTNKPGIISFAGGLPDPEVFPYDFITDSVKRIMDKKGKVALQYGPTEGLPELKEEFIKFLEKEEGLKVKPENLLITTASQQALDIVGRLFIDASDPILVELPSYMGGLQVFKSYGCDFVGVRMSDTDGIITTELEEKLEWLKNQDEHYKFLYLVPDFQNPSGVTLSEKKRKRIVEISEKYNIAVIEDSPYRQIRFEGKAPKMIYKIDKETKNTDNIISLFTISKTFAPGLRIGIILANEQIIKKMVILKQSLDLCTSSLNQLIAADFFASGEFYKHVEKVKKVYKTKKDAMLAALEKYMPEGVTWTRPEGGLFLWVKLPEGISADDMFADAIKENVAYVIGSAFHVDGSGKNTMRLNFSYATLDEIEEGIKRLSKAVKSRMVRK
ncbi:MAG: PLP-dependent aminotransferase family protein [Elusimicrobiales bacterium]|nr:PLP-dependent aminotransferase family protein [Elusimicrobiales bacterium]HOJ86385.1 PLP-dependent aminotransferase family protein [Elusimicrobiales bacterium]HOL62506.1 PLP-dependent aminotransferase family protein [Elusimicrobiales bacterium]HPO94566.1 PLP-dependent aminotransferase family protein [Elusimicrobiales bacterium]